MAAEAGFFYTFERRAASLMTVICVVGEAKKRMEQKRDILLPRYAAKEPRLKDWTETGPVTPKHTRLSIGDA